MPNPLIIYRWLSAALALALTTFAFSSGAQNLGHQDNPAFLSNGGSRAPLMLFVNGPGRVLPFHDGQMLEVGPEYRMQAMPDRGAVFAGWNRINVFTDTEVIYDSSNNPTTTTSIVTMTPMPISIQRPILQFTVQPATLLVDIPGVRSLTQSIGWQANFMRR